MEERINIIKFLGLPDTVVALLFIISVILWLAPYFPGMDFGPFKIPQFPDYARKKLKIIGPIFFLLLIILFIPIIPQHVSTNSNNANRSDNNKESDSNPNTITILVANFRGPDPENYLVTDKIIRGLRAAASGYSDISIQTLGETITEQTGDKGGSKYAREIGAKRKANIVLWGYYGITSEQVDISVYYEVLRAPKALSLRRNLETQTLPIADLNEFKIQTRLTEEMSYLTLLTVGLARYESGDYDAAIDRFTKAIAQSNAPDQIIDPADIYFYRGNAYYFKFGANGIDYSIADYDKAITLEPDDADAYVSRGNAYNRKGQYDLAIADFDKAIKFRPDDAEAYYNHGTVYLKKGQYDQAITDFDKAVTLKPDLVEAYYNRGNAYNEKGQYDLAIADFDKAIKLKPDDANAYYNRGTVYNKKGQYDLAVVNFDKAITLKPDLVEAYNNRGSTYNEEGEYDLAIADFDKAIKLKPDLVEAYNNRGNAYIKKWQYDQAIVDFDKAIKFKPDDANAYFNRAIAYHDKGELVRAAADLKSVLRITHDPELRQRAEQMLQELGVK